jgi:protein-disulfide isomerase
MNIMMSITQLSATPTILYNGYELPENYKVEDLKYFIDLVNVTK